VSDGDWFAPKRFGLGAGPPIAWQGWAVIGVYVAILVVSGVLLIQHHRAVFITIAVIGALALNVIAAQHTKGGWRWRWGSEDDK
jgi:hypothetical protein